MDPVLFKLGNCKEYNYTRKPIFFIISVLFFLNSLFAEDNNKYSPQKIVITCSPNLPPYSFLDRKDKPKGALIDFWKLWGDRTGIEVEFKLVNWNKTLELMKSGEADVHSGLFYSEIKEEYLEYSNGLTRLSTVIFVKSSLSINSVEDLSDYYVPVLKGSFEEEFMRGNYSNINIELYENYENMAKSAVEEDYPAFVADYPVGMYFIEKYGDIDQFRVLQKLYTTKLRGAVKEGNDELLKTVNDGISMISREERRLIFQKWIRSEEVLPECFFLIIICTGVFLLLLILFFNIFMLRIQVRKKTFELENAKDEINLTATKRQALFQQLAHGLKTPLTLIKNYLEKDINERGSSKDLDIVNKNVNQLINEVIKYMDISKLERDNFHMDHNQVINLTSIIKEKAIYFEQAVLSKQLQLDTDLEENVFIKADPFAIDKVLNNILDNALKFTEEGKITIEFKKTELAKASLIIKDTGYGIPDNQLENIFIPYYQLGLKQGHYYGIGMGLFIVKKLVKSIGCKIDVSSLQGDGTTFTILFDTVSADNDNGIVSSFNQSNTIGNFQIINKIKEEIITDDKKNILIIEDNIEMLAFLQSAFAYKYNVFFAENGQLALDKLVEIPSLELIISDIMMPVMDGREFFKNLLFNKKFCNTPFIFLTAKTPDEEKIETLSMGAIDYISKPFNIEELKAKVDSVIKNKQRQSERQKDIIQEKVIDFLQNFKEDDNISSNKMIKINKISQNYNITKREKEIIELLMDGMYNKEIAYKLECSTRTIDGHISHIYKKLDVSNRLQFAKFIDEC
ncbi:MAG: transporter substrate-binding domain-containing protein [bacterium]|nr:transporter substrate-binding domain-containing protein [bacterium]